MKLEWILTAAFVIYMINRASEAQAVVDSMGPREPSCPAGTYVNPTTGNCCPTSGEGQCHPPL